jgi:hypothetical protein
VLGLLRDLIVGTDGALLELVLDRDGLEVRAPFDPALELRNGSSASAA